MTGTVLVTGANGQLGQDLLERMKVLGIHAVGIDRQEVDLTDGAATISYIKEIGPELVVHCAAYTAVDQAEQEPELCRMVNEEATKHVADACKAIDAAMLYLSTDYIFPGTGSVPYETGDLTGPFSVYGRTKLAGEFAVRERLEKYFIVRISWIYGIHGKNFVKTMLRLAKEREEVRVVQDQIGSPTYTRDLCVLLCELIQTNRYGIYHATNEGYCSWADFAEEIFRLAGVSTRVVRVSSEEYQAAAKRPLNSRLSKKSLDEAGIARLPAWEDALGRYLGEELGDRAVV